MNDFQPVRVSEEATADRPWLASLVGTNDCNSILLDLSKFTEGTHYEKGHALQPRNVLKSGIPLGMVTASKLYAPYKGDATDGTQVFAGFLATESMFAPGSTKTSGALLWFGEVYADKTPVPFDPTDVTTTASGVNIRYR